MATKEVFLEQGMEKTLEVRIKDKSEFKAGNIKNKEKIWGELTSDRKIIQMVKGAKFDLGNIDCKLADQGKSQHIFNESESKAIDKEIIKMLEQGIIEETFREKNDIVSKIFTREKKDNNSVRIILNLKKLNVQLETEKFKMAGISAAIDLLTPNCYMGSIDLVSAYYSVPIHKDFKKLLKFYYKEKLYQFNVLPNGFCQAPYMFTMLLKPVYARLHDLGFISTYYLDDSLLIGKTADSCSKNINVTVSLLDKLGFFIHKDKSSFIPKQEIEYLGLILNSKDMTIRLTERRRLKLIQACNDIKSAKKVTIRQLSALIGSLVASFIAIPLGRIFYRNLEKDKTEALKKSKGDWEQKVIVSKEGLLEIDWWLENNSSRTPINRGKPEVMITTDASKTGFGGVFLDKTINGLWSFDEQMLHINILEIKSVLFSLKIFAKDMFNKHVRIRVDNMTALHCINNMGSCKNVELNKIAKDIWLFAIERKLWLSTEYVASENNQADEPSRNVKNMDTEWMLDRKCFLKIIDQLGFKPTVDLFASRTNKQISKFVSYQPDPEAYWINAFTLHWGELSFYAFPPFNIILKVLRKMMEDKATGILVIPEWKAQPFFPVAMSMLISQPITFFPRQKLLIMPTDPSKKHRMYKKLKLIAGVFSGNNV